MSFCVNLSFVQFTLAVQVSSSGVYVVVMAHGKSTLLTSNAALVI